MTYIGDTISEKGAAAPAAGRPMRFLVNIIDKRELELLEELLAQNLVQYVARNASRKNRRFSSTGFAMLGKDIYVDSNHYNRAKAVLADYYLGVEQATADTNAVPAARRQQTQEESRVRHYPVKKLIMWLVLAAVGYSVLFMMWMGMMR